MAKNSIFGLYSLCSKIDCAKNLDDRKNLKFPHCDINETIVFRNYKFAENIFCKAFDN